MGLAIKRRIRTFLLEENGPTATEYAVMFALILLVVIAAVRIVGTKTNAGFASAATGW